MREFTCIAVNDETKEYFFTGKKHDDFDLEGFVPVTHYFPSYVTPREGLESGWVKDEKDVVFIFYDGYTDITNTNKIMEVLTRP